MFSGNTTFPSRYDAIVVGGRCAGAATALLLARRGLKVLVVERGGYGSDTLSTHALMRGAVMQLHRWGLLEAVRAAGTPPVRRASFHYGDEVMSLPIKPDRGVDALYAPRRTVLDRILVDAARQAGARVRFGCTLTGLIQDPGGRVRGVRVRDAAEGTAEIRADLVIGADGIGSPVARWAGAGIYRRAAHTSSCIYGYWQGLDAEGYQWHYRPGLSAGVIPTNDGQFCVFASCPPRRFFSEIRHDMAAGYHRLLAETAPALATALSRARQTTRLRGFAGIQGYYRQSHGPGWALVGDAGFFKDPITAHGITDALRDAELLARAVTEGTGETLHAYQQQRDAVSLAFFRATGAVASFDWDLERLKAYHLDLNAAMKAEIALFADAPSPDAGPEPQDLVPVPQVLLPVPAAG